ncbi:uroporphyrinogen decarboxylase [Mangrovibacterium diazotrophicum]|uniref:Uroporphyrinogen decarboxylase n=1 Tax=Mangrovibacterium diazotrophicum TaxID=1261403 RepID=A0A419VYG9_9BACT|nr:uroporphyrinogen decarboxylase [Mangrovibacterium diazotrophicum]RKD88209.1 uroporphyrinogen decarboxylase [Mangrovibacterium diazotrophicum]
MQDSIFLKKLKGQETERPPVWFMRQAGRVLPNYNKLKEDYTFHELMEDPKLAAEVTLMPIYDLGVDAAILFSDILVIPNAMGMDLEFTDHGPVFNKPLKGLTNPADHLAPVPEKLEYIYKNIEEIIAQRPANIPLIGFCGAPLTTLCYMVQGISSNPNFPDAIKFLFQHKAEAKKLIDAIADLSAFYAKKQIEHGVEAFQLFETHANLVPVELYNELFMPAVKKISRAVRETGTPFIFFPKGIATGLKYVTPELADFVSIDWQLSMEDARAMVHPEVGLQGNLDPRYLYGTQEEIKAHLKAYIPFFQKHPKWIFNLGHGFLPDIPYENAKFVVDWIKSVDWKK